MLSELWRISCAKRSRRTCGCLSMDFSLQIRQSADPLTCYINQISGSSPPSASATRNARLSRPVLRSERL